METLIEETLTEFFGSGYWVTTVSGLTAIQIALHAAGVERDRIVCCDPIFPFAGLAARAIGARTHFYDVSIKDGFKVTIPDVGQAATVLTSYFGGDPRVESYTSNAPIILDRCQSFGKANVPLKIFASVFSFQDGKFVECGHGGAISFAVKNAQEAAQEYISLGWRRPLGATVDWSEDPVHRSLGISARMSPLLEDYIVENKLISLRRAKAKADKLKDLWNHYNLVEISPWDKLPNFPWKIPIFKNTILTEIRGLHREIQPRLFAKDWQCFGIQDTKSIVESNLEALGLK